MYLCHASGIHTSVLRDRDCKRVQVLAIQRVQLGLDELLIQSRQLIVSDSIHLDRSPKMTDLAISTEHKYTAPLCCHLPDPILECARVANELVLQIEYGHLGDICASCAVLRDELPHSS